MGSEVDLAISESDRLGQEDDAPPAYSFQSSSPFDAKLSFRNSLKHAFKHSLDKSMWFSMITAIELGAEFGVQKSYFDESVLLRNKNSHQEAVESAKQAVCGTFDKNKILRVAEQAYYSCHYTPESEAFAKSFREMRQAMESIHEEMPDHSNDTDETELNQ